MTITTRSDQNLRTDVSRRRFEHVTDMLPRPSNPSPLVRVHQIGPPQAAVYLKLEWMNPFGSIKDRTADYLLRGLEERGELAGKTVVEASSGNTSIALAGLAAVSGSKVITTIPDGVPEAKKIILRMLGAEVWETPDDLCPVDHPKDGAIALARSITASNGEFVSTEQYENTDNDRAHYETTGPEIWDQTDGQVAWFVAGYGTTGTVVGAGRYLKENNPAIRVIGVEAEPGHRIPGMKSFRETKVPGIFDPSIIDQSVVVPDVDAYSTTRDIWREEGLTVGPSTGAVIAAMDRLPIQSGDLVVAISADSGLKYTSYFEELLGEEGIPAI